MLARIMNLVTVLAASVLGFTVWFQTGSAAYALLAAALAAAVLGRANGQARGDAGLDWDSSDGGGGDGGGGGD